MAKTRQEKIASFEEQIEQLNNRKKQELQKLKKEERAARTKRLCSRHGLLESMLPETITFTDEQFKAFLEKTVANDYGRRTLASMTVQKAKPHHKPQKRRRSLTLPLPPNTHKQRRRTARTQKPQRATEQGRAANALSLALARAHLYTTTGKPLLYSCGLPAAFRAYRHEMGRNAPIKN